MFVSLCFLFFVVSKLLIADSIAMQVDDVKGTRVLALPSTTVRQLIGDIALGVVQVGGFEAVMFHVGTHDIPSTGMGYRRSIDAVVEDFAALLDIVRDFNAHCQVEVSAILPRPVDHLLSWYRVQQVNQRLCSRPITFCSIPPTSFWFHTACLFRAFFPPLTVSTLVKQECHVSVRLFSKPCPQLIWLKLIIVVCHVLLMG